MARGRDRCGVAARVQVAARAGDYGAKVNGSGVGAHASARLSRRLDTLGDACETRGAKCMTLTGRRGAWFNPLAFRRSTPRARRGSGRLEKHPRSAATGRGFCFSGPASPVSVRQVQPSEAAGSGDSPLIPLRAEQIAFTLCTEVNCIAGVVKYTAPCVPRENVGDD